MLKTIFRCHCKSVLLFFMFIVLQNKEYLNKVAKKKIILEFDEIILHNATGPRTLCSHSRIAQK